MVEEKLALLRRLVSAPVYEEAEKLLREPPRAAADEVPRVRKQVTDLLPADLEQCPIWEFALDEEGDEGQDETTVRPRPDLESADAGDGYFVVRTEFVAGDGTRFDGYATPWAGDEPASVQPTIVTERGQVHFWLGAFGPRPGQLDAAYDLLGKSADELFPLTFRAAVPTPGASVAGTLQAFLARRGPRGPVVEVR